MEAYALYSSLGGDLPVTRVYIDRSALVNNYRLLCSAASAEGICVVKADAYGHDNEICVPVLADAGCRRFAVSSVAEAEALRSILDHAGFPDTFILILGYTPPEYAPVLAAKRITQCVFSTDYAKRLNDNADGTVEIHIKLDTGMNRLGFRAQSPDETDGAVAGILSVSRLERLKITGIFTHFARADECNPDGDAYTAHQYENFASVCEALTEKGIGGLYRHICNSAGAVRFPDYRLDGVRLGILLYGGVLPGIDLPLSPVMRLESAVSHIHLLKPGESVGYGGGFVARRPTKLLTVPIGYADGFRRDLAGATVRVVTKTGECELPVVGRICMDQCMLDATGSDAEPGDRVIIFGDECERLQKLCKIADTIDYELLCGISARVPRIPV